MNSQIGIVSFLKKKVKKTEGGLDPQPSSAPQKAETSRKSANLDLNTENSDSDKENLSRKRKASEVFLESDSGSDDDFAWKGELGDNPIGSQSPNPASTAQS